ncbi:MAG: FAD-dependent oxidoreductase [Dongiaceae bacterium]
MTAGTDCDLLVLGSGAGGLTAAVTAARRGLSVIVAEKASLFGGSTALSGGWVWIPCNPAARRDGIEDSLEAAETYIRAETGDGFDAARVRAYLEAGPRMLEFLERETEVRFVADHSFSDYHPDQPGGRRGGRSLVAAPFDGRRLGPHLARLRPPLRQQTFLGLSIGSGALLKHFLNVTRSPRSAAIVARLMLGYGVQRLRYGRGIRLYNGNALAARLARAALDNGVALWLDTTAESLLLAGGRVVGARLRRAGQPVAVTAGRGVVLATGGFPRDAARRAAHYPAALRCSIAPAENSGDGIRMAEAAGARLQASPRSVAYTAVFSRLPGPEGALFPHFIDRAKPGIILVDETGQRFCNEAESYHDVAQAMIAAGIDGEARRAFFVADHRAVRRYGLGAARPAPLPLGPHLRSGYLSRAGSPAALARLIGVDPAGLEATVADFNAHARRGEDPAFGRGATAYNIFQGDHLHRPNGCLAPLETPPFYAVAVRAGDFGTFAGLPTDAQARVLDAAGRPIPGLRAAGNDGLNVFGGACLGGGVTVGPAMVFGFIAGNSAAEDRA